MKKKTKTIIIAAAALVACTVIGISILAVQRGGLSMVFAKPLEAEYTEEINPELVAKGRELMALVESKEEAEKIAGLYGITLISYVNGVAEYTTEQDLQQILELGKEKGYPALFVNYEMQLMN